MLLRLCGKLKGAQSREALCSHQLGRAIVKGRPGCPFRDCGGRGELLRLTPARKNQSQAEPVQGPWGRKHLDLFLELKGGSWSEDSQGVIFQKQENASHSRARMVFRTLSSWGLHLVLLARALLLISVCVTARPAFPQLLQDTHRPSYDSSSPVCSSLYAWNVPSPSLLLVPQDSMSHELGRGPSPCLSLY